jgi:hypothetical protein
MAQVVDATVLSSYPNTAETKQTKKTPNTTTNKK